MRIIRDRPRAVDLDAFLSRPLFAHLATSSEQGPRDSPVWFCWEQRAVWIIGSRLEDSFPERVARDPRCAIGIVDFDRDTGLVQHVGMRGQATVEPFDRARAQRLLARYLGQDQSTWEPRFRSTLTRSDNLLIRFAPVTVVTRDVSYET